MRQQEKMPLVLSSFDRLMIHDLNVYFKKDKNENFKGDFDCYKW